MQLHRFWHLSFQVDLCPCAGRMLTTDERGGLALYPQKLPLGSRPVFLRYSKGREPASFSKRNSIRVSGYLAAKGPAEDVPYILYNCGEEQHTGDQCRDEPDELERDSRDPKACTIGWIPPILPA